MSSSEKDKVMRLFASTPDNTPTHQLKIETGHPLVEAFVINGSLELVAQGQNTIDKELPEGTYQVKFRAGNSVTEQWVELTQDRNILPETIPVPDSSMPSENTWSDKEREVSEQFIVRHKLAVIIRDPEHEITPSDKVSIRSLEGDVLVQTRNERPNAPGWEVLTDSPVVGLGGPAEPGPYLLRVSTPDIGTYEMIIWVNPNYKTRVYLTRKYAAAWKIKRRTPHLGSATVHMVLRDDLDPKSRRRSELAEIIFTALQEERSLLISEEIIEALQGKCENVMLGLLVAHMLHIHIKNSSASTQSEEEIKEIESLRQSLKSAILNLDKLIPGCPDVGALGIAYGVDLQDINYGIPPMLAQSWTIIAAAEKSLLVPIGSYASRISPALTAVRPWLVWRTNQLLRPSVVDNNLMGNEMENLYELQDQIKNEGPVASNYLSNLLATTNLDQYKTVQELAQSIGFPSCSLKGFITQKQLVQKQEKKPIINKTELIKAISKNANLTKSDAGRALDSVIKTIESALKAGNSVSLPQFGTFTVKERSERKGRNPQTGESITIAATKTPSFKASKILKDGI